MTDSKFDYEPLPPNIFVRKSSADAYRYIGLKRTAIEDAIAGGLLEPAVPLNPDGRAQGWWGHQINAYHAKVREKQKEWTKSRRAIAARETERLAQAIEQKSRKPGKARR
jgi:hypothetical protein